MYVMVQPGTGRHEKKRQEYIKKTENKRLQGEKRKILETFCPLAVQSISSATG
jgi:hypothetical protein